MERDEDQRHDEELPHDITGPDGPTGEATYPPGNGVTDEAAVREGWEKLDQAGGGH